MLKQYASIVWFCVLSFMSSCSVAEDFYITDVSETMQDNAPALVMRFTDAIDTTTDLSNYISVTPVPAEGGQWVSNGAGQQWILPFVEPSTEYTVKVIKPLTSVRGETLTEKDSQKQIHPFVQTIKTRELKSGANFASSGSFLIADIKNGIPVTVVNQKEVDLDVFRVRDVELNKFIAETHFQGQEDYYSLQALNQYADLVHTARYSNDARTNQRTTYNFNLAPVLEKNEPGVYVAVLRQPGVYTYSYDIRTFTITDIGLHVRQYHQSLMVYSHTISTSKPLANVSLQFWWPEKNQQKDRELQAQTGQDGSYQLSTNDLPAVVIARQNNQISFLSLNKDALDLSAYTNVAELYQPFQAFLYGPRDLYRPGEHVTINMLLRDFDGSSVPNMPVETFLYDARGEKKQQFTWHPGQRGLYQTHIELAENAPTGLWRLDVKIGGQAAFNSYFFHVEEFLPETLTLSFYDGDRNQMRYEPKTAFEVPVQGDYLYGAPAAGNKADAVVNVSAANHIFPELKDYYFGDDEAQIHQHSFTIPAIKLDEKGQGKLAVPDEWQDIRVPLNFSINASVYESGGRPVTRKQNVIQLPVYEKLVGIQPQFKDQPASNQTVQFKLLSVDVDGHPVDDTLTVRLLRDHREYFWEYDNSRGWYWDFQKHRYVTGSSSVKVGEQAALVEFPVEWGKYDLEVTSSSGAVSTYHFETEWSWASYSETNLKPDVIQMSLNKEHYAPGETAQLRLNSPVAGEGLINIESSDGVMLSLREQLVKGENQIAVAIPKSWNRHDLYLTVMALTPADQVTEVAPKRAIGLLPLPIRRADAVADVVVSSVEKIEPNKVATAHVAVSNAAELGQQKLYATVALVDKGVLNITNYHYPKPEQYFFAQRRFEARYFDIYGKIINNLGYDMLHQRFGGDAEAEELSHGGEKPKSDVQIVSFFSEPVELINGQADVSFDLPDFNGKLQWMVVVYGDHSYGSASTDMIVADKLVTQISMPRFIAMGDQSRLSFDLHNLSDREQQFDVRVDVEGEVFSPGLVHTLTLADKQKTNLTVPVTGGVREGQGVIRLHVSNHEDIDIDRVWRLGVRSPYPWQSFYQSAVIAANTTWQPTIDMDNLRAETVKGLLTVSNRPAINFQDQLEHLLNYPYGCLEQTTSSTYPWILLDVDTVGSLKLTESLKEQFNQEFTESFRQQQIQEGIRRLHDKQLDNGGFGYWTASDNESHWGSVYATELLVDARLQGITVDEQLMKLALQRLNEYLRGNAHDEQWSDDSDYYDFAFRAYAAFVLAKTGTANLSQVRRLFESAQSSQIKRSSLAWMHLAAALHLLNDNNRAKQANETALAIKRERNRYYRDYGSLLRDTALSLAIALEYKLDEGNLAEELVTDLQHQRWFSTQERIAMAKVAKQYQKGSSVWTAQLITAQSNETVKQKQNYHTLLSAEQLLNLQQLEAGNQKLYASLQYHGAPLHAPELSSNGLNIVRRYYDLHGKEIEATNLINGDLVVVGLTVSTSHGLRIPDALVVELLPAGLELENQNLSNASVNLDEIVIEEKSLGDYYREPQTLYQEYRDDRYVAAIEVNDWRPTQLFYLARAVTPGTYQVPNPYVEDMYRPDYRAIGKTWESITISPR